MYAFNPNVIDESMNRMSLLRNGRVPPPPEEPLINLDKIDFEAEDIPSEISFEPQEPTYAFKYGPKSEPYREQIEQMESEHGFPKGMLPNLIGIESNWNPKVVSKAGAGGLMQLMPETAKMLGVKDVFNPRQNIKGGVAYLKKLKKRFGTWEKVWAAYNMGPTALAKGRAYPPETKGYVKRMKGFRISSSDTAIGSTPSPAIDFESDEPIQPLSVTGKEPPGIYMPKEQSFYEKVRSLIADPGIDKDKASNIIYLSDTYGISPALAEKHYDELKGLIFEGTHPTSRDVAGGLMSAAVATGIIFNPVATAIGVGTFMGLDELENYIISQVENDPYVFQEGKGISDLLDAHGLSKDAIDLLDFTWKMPIAGGTTKFGRGVMGAIAARIKGNGNKVRFVNKVAEDVKTKGVTPDEAAIDKAEEFGVSEEQLLKAQKNKEVKVEPKVDEPENPLEITRPSGAIPTHTFTSTKGNFYEKIGEDWYNSKGRKVTNVWVIRAAEKKKVKFGEDVEAAAEREIEEIEEKTGKRIEEVTDEEIGKYVDEKVDEAEPEPKFAGYIETRSGKTKPVFDTPGAEGDIWDIARLKKEGRPVPEYPTEAEWTKSADVTQRGVLTHPETGEKIVMPKPDEILTFEKVINPNEKEALELFYNRRVEELSEEEVELFLEDHRSGKLASDPEINRFLQDEKTTEQNKGLYAKSPKAVEEDPDLLMKKMINDVNRWYKGDDSVDIVETRNTLDMLRDNAEPIRLEYFDPPDTIWLSWKEEVTSAAEWARKIDRIKIEPTGKTKSLVDTIVERTLKANETTPRVTDGEWTKLSTQQKNEIATKIKEGKYKKGPKLYSGYGFLDKAAKKIFSGLKRNLKPTPRPPEPFGTIKEQAKEIILKRRSSLDLANYDTNKFINSIEQRLDLIQREAMPFVIEKTDVPKELGRPDLSKVISKDKVLLKEVAKEVKQHFNEGWRKIKKHLPNLTVRQIEDYITHLWEIPRHRRAEAVAWFQTQNRFLEKRFIDTWKEGIERGFKPKTLDISEIIRIHDAVSNRSIENIKYVKSMLALKDQGMHLMQRTGTAPLEWIEVDYPAITRRIPLPKRVAGKSGEFVKELKVRVHPDLVRPLKAIFEQRFDHPVISAYEAINGILKKSMLSLNLFHHGALGETGTALTGLFKTAKILFDPVKIYNALVKGEYEIFKREAIARDSIEHGVQYGATADIPVSKIQGYLDSLAKKTENTLMLNRLTKGMKGFNSVWDKALWNYVHDTLKLYGYESLVSKLDPNMGAEATRMAKREIGQIVNDTFGGQNWDTLMMTPKEVQMLTWSLLSADWTFSTTRQALAPTGIGRVYKESAHVRRKMGRRFWFRAALYFGIGINGLNVMFRKQDMKENPQYYRDKDYTLLDKTMLGNTIGKKTKLFVGRYKDGTERYIRWGKQFIDFYELIASPFKKLGGKAAPVPQMISEIFTGHTLSGFRNDDVHGKKGFDFVAGIFKTVAKAPIPLSLRRLMRDNIEFKPTDVFMPSSKGMSRYRALEYFKTAIIDQDMDLLRETYEGALKNNLPAYTLFNGALSWTENEIMAEVNKSVADIRDAEMKLNVADSAYDKRRYGIILRKLQKEKADKEAGFRLFKIAAEKARIYGSLGGGKAPKLPTR